jgi:hypothetical protein
MATWKKIANKHWEEAGRYTSKDCGGGLSKPAARIKRAINRRAKRIEARDAMKEQLDAA